MSMNSAMHSEVIKKLTANQLKGLVSYCLMVNAACPDLTVGEIHEFVVSKGKRPVTIQRTQRVIDGMVADGMAHKRSEYPTGSKKQQHRYYPCDGTYKMALMYSGFLPVKLGEFADLLMAEVNDALGRAQSYIRAQNKTVNGAMEPVDFAQQQTLWNEGG